MCIYLPDGFNMFPKFWGRFVENIVTSINGYFLVTVSENGCVHCFFIFLCFFLFVSCFLGLNNVFFLSCLWPVTFSASY